MQKLLRILNNINSWNLSCTFYLIKISKMVGLCLNMVCELDLTALKNGSVLCPSHSRTNKLKFGEVKICRLNIF